MHSIEAQFTFFIHCFRKIAMVIMRIFRHILLQAVVFTFDLSQAHVLVISFHIKCELHFVSFEKLELFN